MYGQTYHNNKEDVLLEEVICLNLNKNPFNIEIFWIEKIINSVHCLQGRAQHFGGGGGGGEEEKYIPPWDEQIG